MTTLTASASASASAPAPAPAPAYAPDATGSPLLQLHRQLFPERYADVPLDDWTAATAVDLGHLVADLSTDDHDADTAAALADVAHQLADVDELGPADALDAAATVLETACRRLLVADVVAL